MTTYHQEKINFGIDDIGSEVLKRFSDDMYKAESILRELVKNASDSYYQLENYCYDSLPDDYCEKKITIDIEGDKIFITDFGIGCDKNDIRKLIKIAISDKTIIAGTTGFRGIGFWAGFSAGDKIIVESTRYNSEEICKLEINTYEIRKLISPNTDIGAIMNDPKNISLKVGKTKEKDHYTQIVIQCQNRPGKDVGQQENRLYDLIHRDADYQTDFIKSTCTMYLPDIHPCLNNLKSFYDQQNIPLFSLYFNGTLLKKDFSNDVEDFKEKSISISIHKGHKLKSVPVAKCWFMRSKVTEKGGTSIVKSGLKGFRIYKDGYPIGSPNMFTDPIPGYDDLKGTNILDHYLGEIHIVYESLTADANGEDLVDGLYKREFIKEIRTLYKEVIDEEYTRSNLLGRKREFDSLCADIKNSPIDNENLIHLLEKADELLKEHNKNILGRPSTINSKKNLDKTEIVKSAAKELKKIVAEKNKIGLKSKLPEKPKRTDNGKSKKKNSSTASSSSSSVCEMKVIKIKLQKLITDKLERLVDEDTLQDLIKEVDAIFEA